jgi:amino acid transporter
MDAAQLFVTLFLVVMIIAGIGSVFYMRKRRRAGVGEGPDYRAFYVLGLTFTPLGVIWVVIALTTEMSWVVGAPFLVLGLLYLAVGLKNRDRWQNPGE